MDTLPGHQPVLYSTHAQRHRHTHTHTHTHTRTHAHSTRALSTFASTVDQTDTPKLQTIKESLPSRQFSTSQSGLSAVSIWSILPLLLLLLLPRQRRLQQQRQRGASLAPDSPRSLRPKIFPFPVASSLPRSLRPTPSLSLLPSEPGRPPHRRSKARLFSHFFPCLF